MREHCCLQPSIPILSASAPQNADPAQIPTRPQMTPVIRIFLSSCPQGPLIVLSLTSLFHLHEDARIKRPWTHAADFEIIESKDNLTVSLTDVFLKTSCQQCHEASTCKPLPSFGPSVTPSISKLPSFMQKLLSTSMTPLLSPLSAARALYSQTVSNQYVP